MTDAIADDASRTGQASGPRDQADSARTKKTPPASGSRPLICANLDGAGTSFKTRGGVVSPGKDEGPDTTPPPHAHNLASKFARIKAHE